MKIEKTIDQLKAELQEKQEAQLRELEVTNKLREMLPDGLERFTVYCHATSYKADYYISVEGKSYPPDNAPTVQTVRELAAIFPPEPMKLYKGTYKTFFAVGQFERLSAKDPGKMERDYTEEQDVCPWFVTAAPASFSSCVEIEWFTVVDGLRVSVTVKMPLWGAAWLGRVNVYYEEFKGGRRVDLNTFTPNREAIHTLFDENETPVAELYPSMCRWSTPENPGEHEVYWVPITEKPVTIEALCRAMEWTPKPVTV